MEGRGGGLLSAVPCFALGKLVSVSGAIVLFAAIALVLLLLVTKISIRSAGRKVIAKVDAIEDRRKARLINETVGEDETPVRRRRPAAAEELTPTDVPAAKAQDLKLGEGGDTLSETFTGKRRRHNRMRVEESDLNTVISEAAPVSSTEPSLDFLPTSGSLPRDTAMYGDISYSPIKKDEPEPIPPIEEYDPFETYQFTPDYGTADDKEDKPAAENLPDEGAPAEGKAADPADGQISVPAEEIAKPPAVKIYQKPPLSLLKKADRSEAIANDSPYDKGKLLTDTLASFNINAKVVNIVVGPVVTRFELQPAQGVRVNRITALSNDIALALAAPRVRIEAPIPGKAAVGIEIPNKSTAMVRLREVLDTREFSSSSSPLTFALGKSIDGKPVIADLEKMPHMLIAGATGSGKSVCINSIILSTLYKSTPDEVRMILIDPKVVELSIFAPVPHLYCQVVTDAKKASGVLKWACNEMEQRYNKMGKVNARDLTRFNALQEKPEDRMPRLMIIIDELADLMMVSAKEVEESITRIAQLGRAAGIHLIVATQRPSVDVITGLIKTNIPSRIAFAVSSAIDSRVILDTSGAEKLLGHGDMLFHPNGAAKPTRAQGAYVSDEEVESVMQFFTESGYQSEKDENVLNAIPELTGGTGQGNGKQEDELLPDAVRIVMDSGSASISMIQRRLRVGYARAARLVDIMEQMKLVSGFDGSKPRKVLIDEAGYAELFGGGAE
ncbi:MAG: DNA translocase FtsK [Clostridiales bacterium]|nr:DNA translocase FtsK [Clostridiales bacterium]